MKNPYEERQEEIEMRTKFICLFGIIMAATFVFAFVILPLL